MKQIKIKGKKYNLKYTIRSLFLFEQIQKKPFQIETLLDHYVFYYCLILANNKDCSLTWDEFIDALDDDVMLFQKMNEIVETEQKKNEIFESSEETTEDGEEKKS